MAAKGLTLLTLADVAKTMDKNIGSVAEVLIRENAALNDIPYQEMNEGTVHKESIRSALPNVYYRKANQAIPASKTTIEERSFGAAHFESKSQMDEAVAKRGGTDRIAFNRWNQAQGHIQAQALEQANLLIYGSPMNSTLKTPGLADIFSTLVTTEETSKQIINGGGQGADNTSIWLVCWGAQSVFGVYPGGTQAGMKRTDRSASGPVQIYGTDVNGNPGTFYGYEEQFELDHGLVVKDFRQVSRGCNISVLSLQAGNGYDLIDMMISMSYKIYSLSNGKPVFYCNRTIEAWLDKQSLTKVGAGAGITYDNYQGQRVLMFRKIPVRRMDAILNTEAVVV